MEQCLILLNSAYNDQLLCFDTNGSDSHELRASVNLSVCIPGHVEQFKNNHSIIVLAHQKIV